MLKDLNHFKSRGQTVTYRQKSHEKFLQTENPPVISNEVWVHVDYNLRHSTGVANLFPYSYKCLIDHIIFVWGPRNLVSGCIQICMLLWEWCEGETDFLMGMIWFGERREILRGKCRTTRTDLCLPLSWLWQSWVIHQTLAFTWNSPHLNEPFAGLWQVACFPFSPTFGGRH